MPDRSSHVSIAMSLVGIVEDKLATSTARHIRFVYSLISRRYFLSLGGCADSKMPLFRPSTVGDHDFPAAPRLTSKTKYLIFSAEQGRNFLLAWKETAKPRVLNSSLRRLPR